MIVEALLMFMANFAFIFLKSYQTQAVIGGLYITAFIVSVLMTATQVLTVTLIVSAGWGSFPPLALGGGIGVISGMYLYRKHNKE